MEPPDYSTAGRPAPSRTRAWVAVIVALAGVAVASRLVGAGLDRLLAGYAVGDRKEVLLVIGRSVLALLVALGLLVAWVRSRGERLTEHGLSRPAPWSAWVASGLFALLWTALILGGALGGSAPVLEASLFNLAGSLLALIGGAAEEVIYRGFVMDRLERGGVSRLAQVLAAGLLFGLAHAGWGSLAGGFEPAVFLGATIPTTIMGWAFGGIYLLGRRSLAPVVAGHGVMNLLIEPWLVFAAYTGSFGAS